VDESGPSSMMSGISSSELDSSTVFLRGGDVGVN